MRRLRGELERHSNRLARAYAERGVRPDDRVTIALPDGVDEKALRMHLDERRVRSTIPRSFEWVDQPLRDDAGKVRRSALQEARLTQGAEPQGADRGERQ